MTSPVTGEAESVMVGAQLSFPPNAGPQEIIKHLQSTLQTQRPQVGNQQSPLAQTAVNTSQSHESGSAM